MNEDQRLKKSKRRNSGIHGSDGALKSGTSKEEPEKPKKQTKRNSRGARAEKREEERRDK
jgi:hypothetical protein